MDFDIIDTNLETNLSELVGKAGHFVALGRQSEANIIGADRFEITDDKWKESIIKLMEETYMIIFRPGTSEGLLWEFNTIVSKNLLHKTIVCMYNVEDGRSEYNNFRNAVKCIDLPKFSYFSNYVFFDAKNKPHKNSDFEQIPIYKNLINENKLNQKKENSLQEEQNGKYATYVTIILLFLFISIVIYLNVLHR
jgi:hypothetical protein